jgi:DNA-binding CsgD family transcriptional regulator
MGRDCGHVRGRLSQAEGAEIKRMAESGWTPGRIAVRLSRPPSTINSYLYRLSLRAPAPRSFAFVRRNGVAVRSFTAEEDRYITELRVRGLSTPKIAKLCGVRFGHQRNPATIRMRLVMLANVAEAA